MSFTKGNLALRDHLKSDRRVFLFEQNRQAHVQFKTELTFFNCDYFPTFDTAGHKRIGIKFFFKRKGALVSYELDKVMPINDLPGDYFLPSITERSGMVLSRVGQGAYRKSIINRWENRCAVTGFTDSRILIASHIHPWKDAKDDERLDVNNGILLSPTYDALFDKHLITFENSGKIVVSESVHISELEKIGITGKERIVSLNSDNAFYLTKHQSIFGSIT